MAATWTCPHCHADVLGSSCECEGYDAGKIAQLEEKLAEVRRLVTVASGCWCSVEMCDNDEHLAMEELIAWTEEE